MDIFRGIRTRKLLTLIVGITFLNMSFILAEITFFGLDKNSVRIQNLDKNGIEGEKETGNESKESDETLKEIDLSIHQHLHHHGVLFSSGEQRNKALHNLSIHQGFKETFFTPPDHV